ncbi:hypothetical protein [Oerskovia jenensis]|uniref:hypothetical protein n=1 Tax=Oerskovia jenensis TaxID=162169 RepID=UPI0036DE2141
MPSTTSAEVLPGYWVDPETGSWLTIPWPGDESLPWNHPDRLALLPPSLGSGVIRWAESWLLHPITGAPWRYTRGQKRFMYLWYAVDPATGRWLYRSGVKRGAKGTGKDPFAGSLSLAALCGPVELDHFEGTRPIGRARGLSKVQIAANSLSQAKDLLDVANAMISDDFADEYEIDAGETRTTSYNGRLELLTFSEKSSEGAPATDIFLNESHHMTESSGGHKVANVARRNVGKSPATVQARLLELTNAHQMGLDSVAEDSYLAWQKQQLALAQWREAPASSRRRVPPKVDILYDSIEAPPIDDFEDPDQRMAALKAAYSDAPWADLERLGDEVMDPRTSVGDTIRFYFNGLAAAEDSWVEPDQFDALAATTAVEENEQVTLFLDCSKSSDATALMGCRLSDGHVFYLGKWERPHGLARKTPWRASRTEVDARVRAAFERYRVVWFGVDPSPARDDEDESLYWLPLINEWHRDFRKRLKVWATPGTSGHSVMFDMRMSTRGAYERNRAFTIEAMATALAIEEKTLTHDGTPALRVHVHNAKRRPNAWGHTLGKENRDSKKHVDLAVAMVGARLGRTVVLNSGKVRRRTAAPKTRTKVRVMR